MFINYDSFEADVTNTVRAIEDKPHVRYIRYLLSKMISPWVIKRELLRLGLSAPYEPQLQRYYAAVIDPLVQKHKLTKYYAKYKALLTQKNNSRSFANVILNFELTFEKEDDSRVLFSKLIHELEIEEMWSTEIIRYYGGIENVPLDESGERLVKADLARNVEKVLIHSKRYVIDKMILENVPITRIVKFMGEKHNAKFNVNDLYAYSKYFFNFQRKNIEEIIEKLESERSALAAELEALPGNDELTVGEKMNIRNQYEKKLEFLDDTIREFNALYSATAYKQATLEDSQLSGIFKDIIVRGYSRYVHLDQYRDRDVVDPLAKVTKMITGAADKFMALQNSNRGSSQASADKGAGQVLLELYQQRVEEVRSGDEKAVTAEDDRDEITIDDIEGLDE